MDYDLLALNLRGSEYGNVCSRLGKKGSLAQALLPLLSARTLTSCAKRDYDWLSQQIWEWRVAQKSGAFGGRKLSLGGTSRCKAQKKVNLGAFRLSTNNRILVLWTEFCGGAAPPEL